MILLGALVGMCLGPSPGAAQSALDRVETLIAEGRTPEARTVLERWWEEERAAAAPRERQQGLWLRGRLTLEGDRARLDFRRLVVEHPGGPYSDDALLRLGQAAHAEGDLGAGAQYFRTLVRDYPSSPLRDEARAWLDRFGQEVAPAGRTASSAASPRSLEEGGEEEASAGERDLPYAVQLGAFSSERRARRLWERARSVELDPRLVRIPESGLIRVRVGRFADSPGAEEVLHRVRDLGFEATIVTDALKEEALR